MALPLLKPEFDAAAFLDWDSTQTIKHEYIDGEVFAMAGVQLNHARAAGNLYLALRGHLGSTPCQTFMSDVKLRVEAANCYFYPDLFVTCSAADRANPMVQREPMLIVEVLSPSTAAFDRGQKFAAYRQLPTLQEYVLIDTDARAADVYRRGADGLWVLHPFAKGETTRLASVDLQITAADLFAQVTDQPAPAPQVAAQPPTRPAP